MSVLVNGMEMPTSCAYCRFEGGGYCFAKGEKILHVGRRDDVHPDCPLVHVPPHGRLIDADELKLDLTRFYDGEVTAKRLIDEQPTIIPAETPKEEWISADLDTIIDCYSDPAEEGET